jgi:hypothetical protein
MELTERLTLRISNQGGDLVTEQAIAETDLSPGDYRGERGAGSVPNSWPSRSQ